MTKYQKEKKKEEKSKQRLETQKILRNPAEGLFHNFLKRRQFNRITKKEFTDIMLTAPNTDSLFKMSQGRCNADTSEVLFDACFAQYQLECAKLARKYGLPKYDYFSKNPMNSRWDEGLQIHHIDEWSYPNLSEPGTIANEEYQKPEHLVYCTIEEHFMLHLLIAFAGGSFGGCSYLYKAYASQCPQNSTIPNDPRYYIDLEDLMDFITLCDGPVAQRKQEIQQKALLETPVYCYLLTGQLEKIYSSCKEASDELEAAGDPNWRHPDVIYSIASGTSKRRTFRKRLFSFTKAENFFAIPGNETYRVGTGTPVYIYNSKGDYTCRFNSQKECCETYSITPSYFKKVISTVSNIKKLFEDTIISLDFYHNIIKGE